ncbi:hypothetical protein [Rivibacter subsaxonicus]|uniref:Uncharacterized protein n=1 Tax=Rivibacter subsaxonicus TaxID=457575 RepID=A0A4Q7VG76_9BURK|nr:hypothetical protein [Rivibacter subsaxonicus]RZT94998.1 hypothetical protein EV670_2744 [Rivibacter subsaxonicus]
MGKFTSSKPPVRPGWPAAEPTRFDETDGSPSQRDNWFDSSWELRRGLVVAELDTVPDDFLATDTGKGRTSGSPPTR